MTTLKSNLRITHDRNVETSRLVTERVNVFLFFILLVTYKQSEIWKFWSEAFSLSRDKIL